MCERTNDKSYFLDHLDPFYRTGSMTDMTITGITLLNDVKECNLDLPKLRLNNLNILGYFFLDKN